MRSLNQFVEGTSCPGFKTYDYAMAKIARLEQQTSAEPDRTASYVIVERRRDQRFIIVIINPDITPVWYVAQGVAVWS